MKKFFAIILAVLVFPAAALAQQQQPATAAMGAAAQSLVGTYKGKIPEYFNMDFKMTIAAQDGATVTGNIFFWYPERGCGNEMPLTGKIGNDGTIAVEMRGQLKGCDYTMTLTADASGELTGLLEGFQKPWKVIMKK